MANKAFFNEQQNSNNLFRQAIRNLSPDLIGAYYSILNQTQAPEQNIGEMKSISRFYYQVYLKLRATYIIRLTMQTLHNFPSTPNRCAPRASDSTNLCALANREVACPYTP